MVFFRDEILGHILRGNSIDDSFIIYGHKGSGKTFILNRINQVLSNYLNAYGTKIYVPIFIDGNRIISIDSLYYEIKENFFSNLLKSGLPEEGKEVLKSLKSCMGDEKIQRSTIVDILNITRSALEKYSDVNIILLYDDIENNISAGTGGQILQYIRYLTSSCELSQHIFAIVCGGNKLYDSDSGSGSPLSNISKKIIIEPYLNAVVTKYWDSILKSDNPVRNMMESFDNHAALINCITVDACQKIPIEDLTKKVNRICKKIIKELNDEDLIIYEILLIKGQLNKPKLQQYSSFTMNKIEDCIMHLKISNLVRENNDDGMIYFTINCKYIAENYLRRYHTALSKYLDNGIKEVQEYSLELVSEIISDLPYLIIIDAYLLLSCFMSYYINHTSYPQFLLFPAKEFLDLSLEKVKSGEKKIVCFEVDFFQPFLIKELRRNPNIVPYCHKEVEIHGGKEDIIFNRNGIDIPIELKAIWKAEETRDIIEIIKKEYISEVGQHAQNSQFGFLIILDLRPSIKPNGIKDNIFIIRDDSTKSKIFTFVFQSYNPPSKK